MVAKINTQPQAPTRLAAPLRDWSGLTPPHRVVKEIFKERKNGKMEGALNKTTITQVIPRK
jgi:hypothetical protein